MLWSMNHIMREDVRRRFVAGFTIEDSSMRYWFCSRSDVFVSDSFDMLRVRFLMHAPHGLWLTTICDRTIPSQ